LGKEFQKKRIERANERGRLTSGLVGLKKKKEKRISTGYSERMSGNKL
jgi:hypothetical protein